MTAGDGKPCRKCGTSSWDSRGNCKQCARNRAKKWYKSNPDAVKEYKEKNKDKITEKGRKWRASHPDDVKENNRRWYEENREVGKECSRKWQRAHPEIVREHRRAGKHRRKAKIRGNGGSYTAMEWEALINYYGGKCLCCGRDDIKLTVDHIVPVAKGGSNDISNIQPLCVNCNCSKQDKTIDYRPGQGLGRWIQRKLFG